MSGEGVPFNYSLWLERLRRKAVADVKRLDELTSAVFDRGGEEISQLDVMLASAISLTRGFREARDLAMKALRARKLISQALSLGMREGDISGVIAVYRQLVELLVALLYPKLEPGHMEEYREYGGEYGGEEVNRNEERNSRNG